MSETPENKTKAVTIAAGSRGLQLATFDDMWRFAIAATRSGLVPKGMEKVESCVMAIQLGAELGLGPMTAMQNIAVIHGRPSVWGDVMLGLCQQSGLFDAEAFSETMVGSEETGDWEACCSCRRLGTGKVITHTFSMKDAKRAGLWDRLTASGKSTPWQQYPRRMLQMRARSWALRDAFPDVLKGLHSAEESRDIVVDTVPSEDHLAQAREARKAEELDPSYTVDGVHVSADASKAAEPKRPPLPATSEQWGASLDKPKPEPTADEPGEFDPDERDPDVVAGELTSDGEEAGYGRECDKARTFSMLDRWQKAIDADGVLTDEAKKRLMNRIKAHKAVIRASRGSRSNEPKTD